MQRSFRVDEYIKLIRYFYMSSTSVYELKIKIEKSKLGLVLGKFEFYLSVAMTEGQICFFLSK